MPGKPNGLYHFQAKFKGRVAVDDLSKEAFTTTWYADVFDSDTGDSRTLDTTGPYLIVIDPQNKKRKGIEIVRVESISQSSDRVTFTNTFRGLSLDDYDTVGSASRAKSWTTGTEIGIVTDFQNNAYLKELITNARPFPNAVDFAGNINARSNIKVVNTPALLTCGSSPTTTVATWTAVTDGEFAITIDGTARDVTGIDFSSDVANLDQVAGKIETAIRALTSGKEEVLWDGTKFTIKSGDTSSSSAITVLSAVSGGSGTDISGVGTAFLDGETGRGTVTNATTAEIQGVGDLTFSDDNQGSVTLSTLAATGGSDEKVGISSNDTTPDYLVNKVTGGDGITVTETGDGGDETLDIDVDTSDTNIFVKTSSGAGDEDKAATLGSDGKFASGFIPTISSVDLQEFSSNDTWTKPSTATTVMVIAVGAGGGGGGAEGQAGGNNRNQGAGGGGGARVVKLFDAGDLSATEAITIGSSGAGGTGGSSGVGTVGTAGGDTSFGSHLTAYGGGGGKEGGADENGAGGGGGGSAGAGGTGTGTGNSAGGAPGDGTATKAIGNQGAVATAAAAGSPAENGGGSGGGNASAATPLAGGDSFNGGGGGGSGGGVSAANVAQAGGAGGGVLAYSTGGGGTAGANPGGAGGAGTAGNSTKCGEGGGGGGGSTAGTGGAGGAGGTPGGGGGGGGGGTTTGGAGGAGGAGYMWVISW